MVTRVVPVRARAVVGDTVMVRGRPAVVVDLLPREPGRSRTARVTHNPPCRACERRLQYEALHRRWRCPGCHTSYAPVALAAVCQQAERSARQLQRGSPGATALLQRAADAGGAESRDILLEAVTGAERYALR
jgi:ribosomal protein L37AE/L43A